MTSCPHLFAGRQVTRHHVRAPHDEVRWVTHSEGALLSQERLVVEILVLQKKCRVAFAKWDVLQLSQKIQVADLLQRRASVGTGASTTLRQHYSKPSLHAACLKTAHHAGREVRNSATQRVGATHMTRPGCIVAHANIQTRAGGCAPDAHHLIYPTFTLRLVWIVVAQGSEHPCHKVGSKHLSQGLTDLTVPEGSSLYAKRLH